MPFSFEFSLSSTTITLPHTFIAKATVLMMMRVKRQYSKPRDVTSCQMRHWSLIVGT